MARTPAMVQATPTRSILLSIHYSRIALKHEALNLTSQCYGHAGLGSIHIDCLHDREHGQQQSIH